MHLSTNMNAHTDFNVRGSAVNESVVEPLWQMHDLLSTTSTTSTHRIFMSRDSHVFGPFR